MTPVVVDIDVAQPTGKEGPSSNDITPGCSTGTAGGFLGDENAMSALRPEENEMAALPTKQERGCCNLHFGWIVAASGTLGLCLSAPGQSVCIGVVILPIMETLDISRTLVTVLYLFGTLTSAIILPTSRRVRPQECYPDGLGRHV